MHQPMDEPIKFYKLKTNEDIVAFQLKEDELFIYIKRPLAFTVENEVMAGRQMLNVREWIPPIVCAVDEIPLPKEYVMFSTDVRDSFKEEFKDAVEFLYNITPRKRERTEKSSGKVVPFSALMKDTSDKPH